MTAVVLGGTGFLGRGICAALNATRDTVAVARRAVSGLATVELDLSTCSAADLADVLTRQHATVLINAAGAVWDYDDEALRRSNVALVRTALDAVATVPWPVRMVQLGSVFEYARPEPGQYLAESSPIAPATRYGRSKLAATTAVLDATRQGRVDGVVLRLTTCLGPGVPASSLPGKVAAELRAAATEHRPAVLRLSPLVAERDFVDSRDVAAAVVAASTAPVTGRVINIGRGQAVPVRRLVDMLIAASGVPATVRTDDQPTGRSADVSWLAVRNDTARQLLDWLPRHDLTATVQAMWAAQVDPGRQIVTPPSAEMGRN